MPPQTTSEYLSLAQSAMQYTRTKLDFGSSNKFWDNARTLCITTLAVHKTYELTDQYLKASNVPLPTPDRADWTHHGLQYIEAISQAALTTGAGNCEENAAVAFWHLYTRGIRPLDYMIIPPHRHAFVVVGAEIRPLPTNFKEWTSGSAVVCDPWSKRSEIAGMLAVRYPAEIRRMFSAYRMN